MGCYARHILPRLIDCAMRSGDVDRHRAGVAPHARGRVLEIGIGSGLNLPHYGREVSHVCGIDPSEELLAKARGRAAWMAFPVTLLRQSAEHVPLENNSIDTAITTWSLCSIPNAELALSEVRRVLRSDGRLLFIEHGQAADPRIRAWQDWIDPFWHRIAGGCHLNRPIDQVLRAAGFRIEQIETGHLLAGPRPWTFHYRGSATP